MRLETLLDRTDMYRACSETNMNISSGVRHPYGGVGAARYKVRCRFRPRQQCKQAAVWTNRAAVWAD